MSERMSERMELRDAAETWRQIEAAIDGDPVRMGIVRAALMAFSAAQEAYNAAHADGDERSGVIGAGVAAGRYSALVAYICNDLMGGAPREEVLARLQKTSDWLERMGWHGIPRFAFCWRRETPLDRDVARMHVDMMIYREEAARMMAAANAV